MSGGPGWLRLLSRNNASFASLTQASLLNINFVIAFKQERDGGGPPILCKNFAGLGRTTSIVSINNKLFSGNGSLGSTGPKVRFGIFLGALLFGPFGSSATTRFLTMNNGMKLGLNTGFGMSSSYMPNRLGKECLSKLRLVNV